jgi:hypothetical protein
MGDRMGATDGCDEPKTKRSKLERSEDVFVASRRASILATRKLGLWHGSSRNPIIQLCNVSSSAYDRIANSADGCCQVTYVYPYTRAIYSLCFVRCFFYMRQSAPPMEDDYFIRDRLYVRYRLGERRNGTHLDKKKCGKSSLATAQMTVRI